MRFLTPQVHKALDVVTVLAFALAPSLVPLAGLAATLSYALAVVHLLVTLSTAFPGGVRRPLPLPGHGAIELLVGLALIALPFITGWQDRARVFYIAAGAVILVVWAVSRYGAAGSTAPAA